MLMCVLTIKCYLALYLYWMLMEDNWGWTESVYKGQCLFLAAAFSLCAHSACIIILASLSFPLCQALEYAKTITKPPVPSQLKQRQKQRPQGFTEHTPYLHDLDVAELTRLEHLRKRHEEEKQAVSLLRKVHAVWRQVQFTLLILHWLPMDPRLWY